MYVTICSMKPCIVGDFCIAGPVVCWSTRGGRGTLGTAAPHAVAITECVCSQGYVSFVISLSE